MEKRNTGGGEEGGKGKLKKMECKRRFKTGDGEDVRRGEVDRVE